MRDDFALRIVQVRIFFEDGGAMVTASQPSDCWLDETHRHPGAGSSVLYNLEMHAMGAGSSINYLTDQALALISQTPSVCGAVVHVPYRGTGPALTDLLGAQVQVMFASMPASIEYIRSGSLRALAVTSATRLEALPDVPTVGQFLPRYEVDDWKGIGSPKNTPPKIIEMLNEEINAALADSKMKDRLTDFGATPLVLSPASFRKLIAEETEKWRGVIRAANIKLG
jgi:tripartite-type tricarboxylate transporter receptor subunit TctC